MMQKYLVRSGEISIWLMKFVLHSADPNSISNNAYGSWTQPCIIPETEPISSKKCPMWPPKMIEYLDIL